MQPIIFVAPPYADHSNGIRSLHKIAHTINQIGGDARLMFLTDGIKCGGREFTNPYFNTPCLSEDDRNLSIDSLVVYPEIIPGNPLCSRKVVRYMGNKDGLLTGRKTNAKPRDFIVSHSRMIDPNSHCILFNADFNAAFHDLETRPADQRHFDATYIGKGYIYGECPIKPESLFIERQWPRGQEQLAYVLRRIGMFYTWDSWTATNVEAILCGAIPYFLRYKPWTEDEIDGTELGPIPRMDRQKMLTMEEFTDKRRKLVENIKSLDFSWEKRVHQFYQQAIAHFERC